MFLKGSIIPHPGEGTWNPFVVHLHDGDQNIAARCLTGAASALIDSLGDSN